MTRARAIELLKGIQFCCDFDDCTNAWDCDECVDAFNMAIEALEQEETLQNLTKPNKSDLIVKGAGEIKDGLYNIKDGKLFQYKANGGTVRTYPIVSADRPKWIPCSERLPEIDKRVIVTGTMWGMWEVDIDRWNGERWVKYGGYVSAWMPLPEAYREDGEEE